MGANHDILANKAGMAIISKIVNRVESWGQIFSDNIYKIGDFGWPRPDYVCFDFELQQSIAFEFKPPYQTKREYLTGLGQTISYLQKHHYSGLILPRRTEDYEIAEHIRKTLSLDLFSKNHIAVICYDEKKIEYHPEESIDLIHQITDNRDDEIHLVDLNQTYWCWWRDISHYEIMTILDLLDRHSKAPGDIYTDFVWPKFWDLMIQGKTKTWEGKGRKKTNSKSSYKSEKQNYKIPLFQLGLIEPSEGRLTLEGYKLLNIGKIFGEDSSMYKDYLTKLVLVEGKHLPLIQDLESFKRQSHPNSLINQEQFRIDFEEFLNNKNAIGRRKPGRTTTGDKISYIRDEFKLWNKLNLIDDSLRGRYFVPNKGIEFNWSRITEILSKEFIY